MGGLGGSGRYGRIARLFGLSAGCLALANCANSNMTSNVDPKYGVAASPRVVALGQPAPKGGGVYRVGKPYTIGGREYVPQENIHYSTVGMASWYGDEFHGRTTANGERFDAEAISAAHPTLPLPSYVRVTNLENNRSLIVRVNDRGPYHGDRLIDVSVRTAKLLGFYEQGLAQVRVEYLSLADLNVQDTATLEKTLRHGDAPATKVAAAK